VTGAIVSGATFRRAEGLEFQVSLCTPGVVVKTRRHEGNSQASVSREDAALVARLSAWQTPDELGVPHDRLAALSEKDLLFWSRGRPSRNLTGAPLASWDGPISLRRNVWVKLSALRHDVEGPLPFMSRRGMLDGATLLGAHFSVWEFERKTHALLIHCCEAHGQAVARLIPLLDGRCGRDGLLDMECGPQVLELLNDFALLESRVPAATWDGTPQLTWLGHAAVLYEAGGARILVDPLFHPRSEPTRANLDVPPSPVDVVGTLDAVLITHGDNDHCNPQALARIPRETRIILPVAAKSYPYQVDMEALLALLGFRNITRVTPWEHVQIGQVDVTAAPFRGEDWGLELAACTYVLRHPQLSVYLNADCVPMPDVYARIAGEGALDVAFLGVTGCAEAHLMPPGFGYGNFYSMWIPAQKRNQWIELCAGSGASADAALLLKCKRAFGYAAGGASFVPMAFSDRGSHVEMARILAERGHPDIPLQFPLGRAVRL